MKYISMQKLTSELKRAGLPRSHTTYSSKVRGWPTSTTEGFEYFNHYAGRRLRRRWTLSGRFFTYNEGGKYTIAEGLDKIREVLRKLGIKFEDYVETQIFVPCCEDGTFVIERSGADG